MARWGWMKIGGLYWPRPSPLLQLAQHGLHVAKPLFWHDRTLPWPKPLIGGTAFILDFGDTIVGVTATHVVDEFRRARSATPTTICQLANTLLNLEDSIIQCSLRRDITTFVLSREHANALGGYALDCRSWPPPTPKINDPIQLVGFPVEMRQYVTGKPPRFAAWGALAIVEDITADAILVRYDPKECRSLLPGHDLPPLKLNLSGCSGGPAMLAEVRQGSVCYFPAGLIAVGPGTTFEGLMADFDLVRIHRIHNIKSDGRFDDPEPGWLPG